jgi:hypothetical protein
VLKENSLAVLTSHTEEGKSVQSLIFKFDWEPSIETGAQLVIFNGVNCMPYSATNTPSIIVPIENGLSSYSENVSVGTQACAQIWKDYKKGIVGSNPSTISSWGYGMSI